MTQEALDGVPPVGRRVVWSRYLANGLINHAAWLRACAEHDLVGDCGCGGKLRPQPPDQVGKRMDYRATCSSCGTDMIAPGGRTLSRRR